MPATITCLLLAAGLGSRFSNSEYKLLHHYKGKPIIAHSLNTLLTAKEQNPQIKDIAIIIGHDKDNMEEAIAETTNIQPLYNPHYKDGLWTSLLMGLQKITTDYIMVLPADMPCLKPQIIADIITYMEANPAKAYIPVAKNQSTKIGNPVLFHKSIITDLKHFKKTCNNDKGAMPYLLHLEKTAPEMVARVPINDKNIFTDIDTKEDFLTIE